MSAEGDPSTEPPIPSPQPAVQTVTPPALGLPQFVIPGQLPIQTGQVAMQLWQSQYPPPDAVERYEAILPGSFDRIMTMVEFGQRSQTETVTQVNANLQSDTKRGAWLGFVVAMAGLFGALFCAWINQPWVAGACVSLPVLGLARALVETGGNRAPPSKPDKT